MKNIFYLIIFLRCFTFVGINNVDRMQQQLSEDEASKLQNSIYNKLWPRLS